MGKRKSEEPLDLVDAGVSPASKRARIEGVDQELRSRKDLNGTVSQPILEDAYDTKDGLTEAEADNLNADDDGELESNSEDEQLPTVPLRQSAPTEGYSDLYLDTINRSILDFDFEKLCSVTLSNINVYACLVCGKYFQGRGPKSHAYFHALEVDHHVYINMETKKVYVLPEGYEVQNKSLDDIKYVVDPKFTEEDVKRLDRDPKVSTDLSNQRFRPGFVGMNNIKANDYLNVVVQASVACGPCAQLLPAQRIPAQRFPVTGSIQYAGQEDLESQGFQKPRVASRSSCKKLRCVSSKKFALTHQSDPVEFLSWFLNNLHLTLGGSKTKPLSSIIQKAFQGKLRIESQAITAKSDTTGDRLRFEDSSNITTNITPYLILTLDLPPIPLFREDKEKDIIPQIPLADLFGKIQRSQGLRKTGSPSATSAPASSASLSSLPYQTLQRQPNSSRSGTRLLSHFSSPRGLDMSPYVRAESSTSILVESPLSTIWSQTLSSIL